MSGLSPPSVFLGTLAVAGFLMTSAGFVALVWRISWGVRGFIEAENRRAGVEGEIVKMLANFIAMQRETNEQVWTALQVQADRLNHWVERQLATDRGPENGPRSSPVS